MRPVSMRLADSGRLHECMTELDVVAVHRYNAEVRHAASDELEAFDAVLTLDDIKTAQRFLIERDRRQQLKLRADARGVVDWLKIHNRWGTP